MPVVNVTLKEGASVDKLEQAKKAVTDQGGKVTKEFRIINGFTAELPDDKVSALESHTDITVEADQIVRTQ